MNKLNLTIMNTEQTIAQMRKMNLQGMATRYETLVEVSGKEEMPDVHTTIGMLAEAEEIHRRERKTELYIRQARFRYKVNAPEITCSPERGLTKDQWVLLCECKFIDKCKNIIIDGPTGCGKSYVVSALGRQACLLGYKTIYHNMNRFIEEIKAAVLSGTYLKLLDQFAKTSLLILDDFGLKQISKDARMALYEILEDRIGRGSTIITSQLPVSKWYEKFSDPNLAEAVLDRLTGYCDKITMKGKSWRSRGQSKA